jgi:Pyruvate/2-oxoacid:ferredoxin oxidoreductase gamma subunit
MEKNIILAGVGGQGILSIAFVIDNAALDAGLQFKQAEVHGMAQRGGAVQSNLRYGDSEVWSDIIPTGKADMVLSVEPLSTTPYVNIPDYPETDSLLADLAEFENIVMVDTAHFARAAGNLRAQNMVTVGAASPLLDFEEDRLLAFVEMLFARKGEKIVAVNQRAFRLGRAAGLFFTGLVDAGMPRLAAVKLIGKLDPDTIDVAHAGAWAEAIADDEKKLETVLAEEDVVACDKAATFA